ncbi:MAG: hypothetical protein H6978_02755 [Gammaproteobacteria bacterium]|nr:hypothetical protein [Gammaproteobacteria bacterium]
MFEFLFKYPATAFATGDVVPVSVNAFTLILIALALFAVLGASWWRSRALMPVQKLTVVAVLQGLVLVVLLAMLAQPLLELERLSPADNAVLVMLDTSRSMALSDDGQNTRLTQATAAVTPVLARLGDDYLVKLNRFAADVGALASIEDIPPPADGSALLGGIKSLLESERQTAIGALIVVSDGADTDNQATNAAIAEIARYGIPVHTIGVGAEVVPEDIELAAVDLPQTAPPGIELSGTVAVRSSLAGPAVIKVYDDDAILSTRDVVLTGNGVTQRFEISVPTGREGLRALRVSIEGQQLERNEINNERRHVISISDRQQKVLYVEGEPRWEYKFIRRAIGPDQGVEFHTLLQTSTNNWYRQGITDDSQLRDGLPATTEELFDYDAIIIGSQAATGFSTAQLDALKRYVSERGGSLMLLGGREGLADGNWEGTPVADVLPVFLPLTDAPTFVREMVKVRPTTAGLRTPWLQFADDDTTNQARWAALPAIADHQVVGTAKPGATVLLEIDQPGQAAPLLVTQRYGRGQVFVLGTGGTWRWQMQMPLEDQSHELFWQRFMQELLRPVPGRISFSTEKTWYADEPRIAVNARVLDKQFKPLDAAVVDVNVVDESGARQQVTLRRVAGSPGEFNGEVDSGANGMLRMDFAARETPAAEVVDGSLFVAHDSGRREFFAAAQNRGLLQQIADATGGRYWSLDAVEDLPAALAFSDAGITRREQLPLWNMPLMFLLLLGLTASQWLLRRHWGYL